MLMTYALPLPPRQRIRQYTTILEEAPVAASSRVGGVLLFPFTAAAAAAAVFAVYLALVNDLVLDDVGYRCRLLEKEGRV